jgi:hypothetical protein
MELSARRPGLSAFLPEFRMTSTLRLRTLVAGVTLALAGAAVAQAPATTPAPAAPATPPAAAAPQATPPASATTPAAPAKTAPSPQERALRRAQRDAAAAASGATQAPRPPSGTATTPGGNAAASAAAQPSPGATKNEARAAARAARRERGDKGDAPIGRQLQNAYADLMTPEEMAAHRSKVKQTKTYADCKTLFEATGKQMEARAKAQNKEIKASPTEICDKAKERGRLTG